MATRFQSPQELDLQLAKPLATLRNAPAQVMDLLVALRRQIDRTQVERQSDLTSEGMAKALDALRQRAMRQVDALEQACQQARAQIEATIVSINDEPTDPQRRMLAIAEHEQMWRRLRELLDRIEDTDLLLRAQAEIEDAERTGDVLRLKVLRAELPTYLRSRSRVEAPALMARLDEAILAHASPVVRRAEAIRRELVGGYARLAAAFRMARWSIAGQSSLPPAALPGWEPNTSVTPGPVSMRVTELVS
jgi:hypothetical protein